MNILILEDNAERIRQFNTNWRNSANLMFAETAAEAIGLLQKSKFDMIFLDHDLGGEEMVGTEGSNTGSEVVRWIVSEIMKQGCIDLWSEAPMVIHSLNEPAAISMESALKDAGCEVYRVPFLQVFERIKIR